MEIKIYFTDKCLTITDTDLGLPEVSPKDIDTILSAFATTDSVQIYCANVRRTYRLFTSLFKRVEAAGGAIFDNEGNLLMIYRNGRYDLPKGHIESGESAQNCAIRECEEETGVKAKIVSHICNTIHTYNVYGVWEIKTTHWYKMVYQTGKLAPQTEEGIKSVRWYSATEVEQNMGNTYPTIKSVISKI